MTLTRLPLQKHQDSRGLLIQNDYPEIFEEMKHFLVSFSEPGVIRGNHYHLRKKEWFLVIQGTAELHLTNTKTHEQSTYVIQGSQPELFLMEPSIAHAFKNIGSDQLVFLGLVNEAFDESDPDTISYQVI